MAQTEYMKPYSQLLAVLDNPDKTVQLNITDLLDILRYCNMDKTNFEQFTEPRQVRWFQQVGQVNSGRVNGTVLIDLFRNVELLKLVTADHFSNFYDGWERLMLEKLDLQCLNPVLETYSLKEADIPVEMVTKWCDIGAANMDSMSVIDLSRSLANFARLKVRPYDNYLKPCWQKCMKDLHKFSATDFGNFVYAIGKLQLNHERIELEQIAREIDRECGQFSTTDCIRIIYGFALLGTYPKEKLQKFTALLFKKMEDQMQTVEHVSLVTFLWSSAKLKDIVGLPSESFLKNWFRRLHDEIHQCSARELRMILEAAWLSIPQSVEPPQKEFWERWQRYAAHNMAKFWPPVLAHMFVRLSDLKIKPQEEWMSAWLRACMTSMKPMFLDDMMVLLRSIAAKGVRPNDYHKEFMTAWQDAAVSKSYYFDNRLSQEIQQLLKQLNVPISTKLESKLHG